MFRRDVLLEVRGLDPDCLGQDFDLVMRIHRWMAQKEHRQYRVVFVPDPVSWTEVPESLGQLARQRKRWHVGLWQTLRNHRIMTFNPRYGVAGLLAVPFFWIFELFAPLIELIGFVVVPLGMLMGLVNIPVALGLVAFSYLYATFITLMAIAAEEATFHRYDRMRDLVTSILAAFAENIGYRQVVAFWRVTAWFGALIGRPQRWGEQQRRGFTDGEKAARKHTVQVPGLVESPAFVEATIEDRATATATATAKPDQAAGGGRPEASRGVRR
jgi:cellulose synthase/poly-beta-1,6-N-acetylglucosamine synthase-like glycosyltransferase